MKAEEKQGKVQAEWGGSMWRSEGTGPPAWAEGQPHTQMASKDKRSMQVVFRNLL